MIALLIGLVFVGLAYGLRYLIEGPDNDAPRSWLDLTLLLGGYLFLFCLKPIQKAVQRRLCRQATR
jgi:O-antigen/teichoic acid export membrane protein